MDTRVGKKGFADVGYEEAIRRARDLIPFFREQAPKCEKARRLTPEVMDALNRNGLIRYLQPRRRRRTPRSLVPLLRRSLSARRLQRDPASSPL